MDTRLKPVPELQHVDDVRKNMRQGNVLQNLTNVQTAVANILLGTMSAQDELKNMKNYGLLWLWCQSYSHAR